MPFRRVVPLAAAVLVLGCGHKDPTGPAPLDRLPPQVVEVHPAARSTHVPYDTAIWARFQQPLDSSTVTPTTVFLKVDTRRIPVSVSLRDSAHTIVLRPFGDLGLRQTHTVELTPRVHTADGAALDTTYFWQFTTISVRRIENPEPADGRELESPVAGLFWRGTDANAGSVQYRVWVGPDSGQVAGEGMSPITTSAAYYLPSPRWAGGAKLYWKVRVTNLETGDEAAGPVFRFHVAPTGTPIDSMLVPVLDFATWDNRSHLWTCGLLSSSGILTGVERFGLAALDTGIVVADAFILMAGGDPNLPTPRYPELWANSSPWVPCDAHYTGIPPTNARLAGGVLGPDSRVWFVSDVLAAQIQSRIRRHPQFFDYSLQSFLPLTYAPLEGGSGVRIYYYRTAGPQRPIASKR